MSILDLLQMLAAETSAVVVPESATLPSENPLAWKRIVGGVEPFLEAVSRRLAEQIDEFEPEIAGYAEYALTNQGKQLRPTLVALSAGATGSLSEAHVLVAAIIEMVHLATLVHDDVIDEAQIRRGRPTVAANWDNEVSVLLGDCLFALALKLAASYPTPDICRAVATATNTVCTGEIIQSQREKNLELTRADYFKVLQMKTGELFALSCELGAYLSGASPAFRTALRHYGLALGTAYQIYDDCLDLFGSELMAGKSLGTDLAKGKLTLPMLIVLEKLDAEGRARVQSWVRDWQPAHFPQVLKLLHKHRALEVSRGAVDQYLAQARQALSPLPATKSRWALSGLTEYLAQQALALGHAVP